MISFIDLLNSISSGQEGQWSVTITEDWMQGRTTYGGLSAALCLQAVQNDHPDLPPLRSAQINFIGPAGGEVTITNTVMRIGKSVAYISSEMKGEKGIATHAVFCFGASRESKLDHDFSKAPSIPSPEQSNDFFALGPGPVFTQYFDCLLAKGDPPISGSDESEIYIWSRHKEQTPNDMVTLLSIADMPPPAVLPMFNEFAPISSMTWMLNFLVETPTTKDGWWLLRSTAEHAKDGYSSQDMAVWNSDNQLIITGKQSVAIFY